MPCAASQPKRPRRREPPRPPPAARRADPAHPAAAPAAHPRQHGLDRGPMGLPRLAPPPGRRPARDSHRVAPPGLATLLAVDIRIARESPAWGSERIRGELLKLGIAVGKLTVQQYRRRGP